jgi:hypothetical protein
MREREYFGAVTRLRCSLDVLSFMSMVILEYNKERVTTQMTSVVHASSSTGEKEIVYIHYASTDDPELRIRIICRLERNPHRFYLDLIAATKSQREWATTTQQQQRKQRNKHHINNKETQSNNPSQTRKGTCNS